MKLVLEISSMQITIDFMERGFQAKTLKRHVVKKNFSRHGASRPLSKNLFPCNPGQKKIETTTCCWGGACSLEHACVCSSACLALAVSIFLARVLLQPYPGQPFSFPLIPWSGESILWNSPEMNRLSISFFFCVQCVRWYHREEHYAACPRDEATQVSRSLLLFLSVQLWNIWRIFHLLSGFFVPTWGWYTLLFSEYVCKLPPASPTGQSIDQAVCHENVFRQHCPSGVE